MAVGNGRQVKVNLSTTEYETKHIVHWALWDDVKKEALPAGTFQLKLILPPGIQHRLMEMCTAY